MFTIGDGKMSFEFCLHKKFGYNRNYWRKKINNIDPNYKTKWDDRDSGMFSWYFERLMYQMGCWSKPSMEMRS